jgi:hypothetical protein
VSVLDHYACQPTDFISKGIFFMNKMIFSALALAGSAALVGVAAVPALAATADVTSATVTVDAGVLSITVPETAALSTVLPGQNSIATLGVTKVADTRAGTANWTATVTLTAMTGNVGGSTVTIPSTGAEYLAGTATTTGTSTLATPTTVTNLSTAKTSEATTGVNGNNSASWTATLTVPIPAQVLAGTYSGVMTQSVS